MLSYKKFPDKYFDLLTNDLFSVQDIKQHPWWYKYEYDKNGNIVCYNGCNGYWVKYEYNNNNQRIYRETCDGYWEKWEYDNNGYIISYEDSNGNTVID